jgi:hypothetical protein
MSSFTRLNDDTDINQNPKDGSMSAIAMTAAHTTTDPHFRMHGLMNESQQPAPPLLMQAPLACGNTNEDHVYTVLGNMRQRKRPAYRLLRVVSPDSATEALATYADCRRPALVVVLVDQVLQLASTDAAAGSSVWVMALVWRLDWCTAILTL